MKAVRLPHAWGRAPVDQGESRSVPLAARFAMPCLVIAFFLWFSALRLLQHYSFRTNAYDLSIFDYGLYYTLKGRFLWTPFLGVDHLLADHFSPALLALVPLYLLHDGPLGLLIVQAGMVAASGIPLFLSARALLGRRALAAGITIAYFGNPFLVRGLLYDFHPEMWLPALFLTGLWLLEVRHQRLWGVAVLTGAMLVKEDVPIYVAVLALYFAFTGQRRVAVSLGFASVVYGGFVALVGLPALVVGSKLPHALSAWTAFGHTIPEILGHFLAHPLEALGVFWTRTVLKLLLTFGFLPILAPGILLAAIPGLFISLSGHEGQRHLAVYYAAPVLPLFVWATIWALRRVQAAAGNAVVYALVAGLMLMNLHYARMFRVTERDRQGRALVAALPRTASIAAPSHVVPHLAKREQVYVIGATWRRQAVDFVLFDIKRGGWPLRRREMAELVGELESHPAYRKVLDRYGYVLFERTTSEMEATADR